MVAIRENIPITENFTEPSLGGNYAVYQPLSSASGLGRLPGSGYPASLSTQQHIDIRTFNLSTAAVPENWTVNPNTVTFSTGPQSSLNRWLGLNASLPVGITTFSSTAQVLDLTAIGMSNNIILALPNFSLSAISLAGSSLRLSDSTNSATLLFSDSLTPLTSGNTTATWSLDSITGVDLTAISTISLIINTTQATTFNAMGLRVVNPSWVLSNLDFDTWNGRLRQAIPPDGNTASVPVPQQNTIGTVWRSASVSGVDDPRPIDGEYGILFYTGSQTQTNSFSLYLREQTTAFITQLDLKGDTQGSLTGQPQPTSGVSEYSPRTIGDLQGRPMSQLDAQTMGNLERTNNPVYTSWVSFVIQWGPNPLIAINNSSNVTSNQVGYQYTPSSLSNNTLYLATCNLTGNTARVQIWNVDQTTLALTSLMFDSSVIPDSYIFPRQAGRVGFSASLNDGDSYVKAIRPRGLMFAEYKSKPLQSLTPVKGARLYAQFSAPTELFTAWTPLVDANGLAPILISNDYQRYLSSGDDNVSTRITLTQVSDNALYPNPDLEPSSSLYPTASVGGTQGVQSTWLSPPGDANSGITNFDQLDLRLAIWMPSAAINSTPTDVSVLTAALVSPAGVSIPITLPTIIPDQWSVITLSRPVSPPYPISGLYRLTLHYNGTIPTTWWLDGVSINEQAVRWDARSVVDDPWKSNYAPWTPFRDKINSDVDGAKFTTIGSQLQIRGQALRQDAVILSAPTVVPQYATLGRLTWPEDALSNPVSPTASATITNTGRAFTFNGLSSVSSNGMGNYYWVFGDGTYGSGPVITHDYPSWVASGTQYTATLTIVDRSGLSATATPIQITLP